MARMPGPESLPIVQARSRGVRRAPGSAIPGALQNLGETISNESNRLARKKKAEDDTLDSARANSDWNTRLLNEQSNYDLAKNPKYDTWEKNIGANLPKHQAESAKLIRDPKRRELFMLQSKDDMTRATLGVRGKAEGFDADKRLAEGVASLDQNLALAAAPGTSKEQSDRIIAQTHTSIDNMVKSGLMPAAKAIETRQNFTKKFASLQFARVVEDDPQKALSFLHGGGNSSVGLLRHFEGFRATPYMDKGGRDGKQNSGWRVGYGSDTITTEDGSVIKVKPGMYISRADADRDLTRRMGEFQAGIVKDVGQEHWAGLPASAQAGLTSVAYNYGSLPGSVVAAVKTGDVAKIAAAVKSLQGHNGGINAKRRAEEADIIAGGAGFDNLAAPDYMQFLEPDDRLRYQSAAEGEVARREKEANDASDLDRYAMGQSIENDLTQMAQTGQATDLNQEQVRSVLGDAKAAEWLTERQDAATIYGVTSAIDGMGNDQIAEHLDALEPDAGDPNFARAQKVYDAAQDKAAKVQKLRIADPALSVQDAPVVRKALSEVDPEKPETIQNVVRARLAAQQAVNIPGAMQQPITKQDARAIIGPIQTTMDMIDATTIAAVGGTKGDAKARRLAIQEAQKVAETEVRNIIDSVEKTYGPYAQRVLAYAISEATRDKEVGGITATVYRKIAKGQKPTVAEFQSLDAVNEASIAEKAVNGELPGPKNNYGTKPSAAVTEAIGKTLGQLGAKRPVFRAPSQKAVDFLKANPQTVADFEKNFGPNTAAQWLPRN